ncbi:MAG: rRNA maturation RNase YbeY [Ekhidna sp.]
MHIQFFSEDTDFVLEDNLANIKSWVSTIASDHEHDIKDLNYIFCSDNYLLSINQEYLKHDYFTDIITFDHSDEQASIEGDIFISIDRVKENANEHGASFENELHRVMAHGLLHLLGFGDKTPAEKTEMRLKEDACLSLLKR